MKKLYPNLFAGAILFVFLVVISLPAHAAFISPVLSDFNDPPSLDGWSYVAGYCNNPGAGGASSGGVGDGYLRYVDIGGSVQGDVLAPPEFLGDYSNADSLTLQFDMKVFAIGGSSERQLGVGFFSGSDTNFSGGEVAGFGSGIFVNGPTDWIHVVVPLDFSATGWTVDTGFNSTSVSFVRFSGDWIDGIEIIGYDNVLISAVPVPATVWLLISGMLAITGVAKRGHR
jgi:hypothetical protein